MIMNAPDHSYAARSFAMAATGVQPMGLLERLLRKLNMALCGLHGHDSVLQYEGTRMFLLCTSCGSESPGWDVAPDPAAYRRQAGTRPAARSAGSLTVARKVA